MDNQNLYIENKTDGIHGWLRLLVIFSFLAIPWFGLILPGIIVIGGAFTGAMTPARVMTPAYESNVMWQMTISALVSVCAAFFFIIFLALVFKKQRRARTYGIVALVLSLFNAVALYFASGNDWSSSVLYTGFVLLWIIYLLRSKRVRNTLTQ